MSKVTMYNVLLTLICMKWVPRDPSTVVLATIFTQKSQKAQGPCIPQGIQAKQQNKSLENVCVTLHQCPALSDFLGLYFLTSSSGKTISGKKHDKMDFLSFNPNRVREWVEGKSFFLSHHEQIPVLSRKDLSHVLFFNYTEIYQQTS